MKNNSSLTNTTPPLSDTARALGFFDEEEFAKYKERLIMKAKQNPHLQPPFQVPTEENIDQYCKLVAAGASPLEIEAGLKGFSSLEDYARHHTAQQQVKYSLSPGSDPSCLLGTTDDYMLTNG